MKRCIIAARVVLDGAVGSDAAGVCEPGESHRGTQVSPAEHA